MKVANEASMLVAQALEKLKKNRDNLAEESCGMYCTDILETIELLEKALDILASNL